MFTKRTNKCFNKNILFLFWLRVFIIFKILTEMYLQLFPQSIIKISCAFCIYFCDEQKNKKPICLSPKKKKKKFMILKICHIAPLIRPKILNTLWTLENPASIVNSVDLHVFVNLIFFNFFNKNNCFKLYLC